MKAAPLLLASLLLVAAVSASSIPPSQPTSSSTQSPASSPSTTNAAAPAKVASSTSRSRRPNDLAASHVYYKAKTLSGSTDSELSAMLSVDSKELLVDKLPGTGTDDETNNEKLVQEELAKAIKAQASKKTLRPISPAKVGTKPAAKKAAGLYDTADMVFNDEIDAGDEDDDEDEYEDDDDDDEEEEDEDDDDDDDDDEDDDEDDIIDDEEVMTGCPDYCRCAGQYPAATTARCRKLQDDQSFGSGIAHLKIENAGNIRLGPYALRRLGLRQLESISIVDTKIVELDRTAFDGLGELFVVNLTNNALTHIHPDTFQNNSQLSLLTIAGNPLSRSGKLQGRDYLLDAPSVTELDFSENQLTRLPRRAFAKMTNLAYINLKNNRLESLDKDLFAPLDELVELDLSHNSLSQLPASLFKDKNLLTLRISGNALRSLKSIKAAKLVTLDASANRLDSIAKEDLAGVPSLEQLYLRANNLRNIHQHAFSDLDQLTYLDLTNNNLGELHEHHLRANSRLQVLLLSDNPELKSLPIFRTNAQEFERYSIYRFECENCGLTYIEPGTFDAMAAMTRLNLAHNKLTGLPQGLLRSLSALRELDLSANRLERLEDNTFEGATSLTKLSIATNSFAGGLRVTPFLKTPNLMKLDASFCGMSRVWSETRVPLKSLKFLSLQKNSLARISVEELRVMPNLAGLDVSRNPLRCDEDLSAAVQWLSDNNVTPSESTRRSALGANKRNNHQDDDDDDNYESQPTEQFNQWSDLAKKRCDSWEGGPPPSRQLPIKPIKVTIKTKKVLQQQQQTTKAPQDSLEFTIGGGPAFKFDFGRVDPSRESTWSLGSNSMNDDIDNAWDSSQDKDEYDQIGSAAAADDEDNDWYRDMIWQVAVLFGALTVALLVVQLALCLWKRRGGGNGSSRGPVLRSSMILRPGMMDTKNCGLVYKPLEEKIGSGDAPHLKHHHAAPPKRHNFYSSSTFHYDKIVPESV